MDSQIHIGVGWEISVIPYPAKVWDHLEEVLGDIRLQGAEKLFYYNSVSFDANSAILTQYKETPISFHVRHIHVYMRSVKNHTLHPRLKQTHL